MKFPGLFPMKRFSFLLGAVLCLNASAEVLDRNDGFKIGQRMTLRPYVSFSMTYDSNVNSRHGGSNADMLWMISPGLSLSYNAESWSLLLSGYYNYTAYSKSENSDLNSHSYGEDLRWNWSNSTGAEKGWSLILGESFRAITAADDLTLSDGRGYNQDSRQFQLSGALMRRFNERWHADVNASYYWLDYQNDTRYTGAMYGWDRWTAGAEVGFAPSKWTDIILAGAYQGYTQDNTDGNTANLGDSSQGFTFQGGLGSYMTERISYRLLAGWSRFEYGDGADTANGFVYTASGNWKIGETWNTMLLATSYYQPSERQYASQSRVDAISWGLAKVMVRGKLRATLDLRYRHETNEYAGSDEGDWDYALDIITGRIGLSYSLNRFFSCFVSGEYQKSLNDESDARGGAYDYDRLRATLGVRLSY